MKPLPLRSRPLYLAIAIGSAPVATLQAQAPPARTPAHEAAHVVQQSPAERAAHARSVLAELAERPAPPDLTAEQVARWEAQTEWLSSVERRLSQALNGKAGTNTGRATGARKRTSIHDVDKATPQIADAATPDGPDEGAAEQQEALELELTNLHEAVQLESRRFQTLSNAMKARHDMAMNTIRNMK